MSFENIAVKADKETVKENFKEGGYLWNSNKDWVLLFPQSMLQLFENTLRLSQKTDSVAIAAFVSDSDSFLFNVYDKGNLVFQFEKGTDENWDGAILKGSVDDLTSLFPGSDKEKIDKILNSQDYTFVEDMYRDLIKELQLPEPLGNWGYDYINDPSGMEEMLEKDLPGLEKI